MTDVRISPTLAHLALLGAVPVDPLAVQSACGISWDANDILRFLGKCKWAERPDRPGEYHLVWCGAKSRGGASYDRKNNKKRGRGKQWYGTFHVKGKSVRAHKFFAVAFLGQRPGPDDQIDHECFHTLCVSCCRTVHRDVNQKRIRRRKDYVPTGRVFITGNIEELREKLTGVVEESLNRPFMGAGPPNGVSIDRSIWGGERFSGPD